MTYVRIHAFFSGRVQGVFFRDYTRERAELEGVTGWVRNLADGRVEAVFEGEEKKINNVIEWLKTRHPYARVTNVVCRRDKYTGEFRGFEVRY